MFLKKVVEEKRLLVKEKKARVPLRVLKNKQVDLEKRQFSDLFSYRTNNEVRIIAEIKKASPAKKTFNLKIDVKELAKKYYEGGAVAISLITEPKFFFGNIDDLPIVKKSTPLPVLRKDFIVDEYEIYESKIYGADAVLLIAEALERNHLIDLIHCARELGIDILFEIHSLKKFEEFYDFSKQFTLGVNNRNLETLEINLNWGLEILKNIPRDIPVIIESGIEDRENIEKFLEVGVSGFLIGSSLMASNDPVRHLKHLRGIE
ncbi:MAG: indole-3-glycerol phosphate synthase TrpC [Proteobacteria bacterium]|nr:indole-3-glycerol phosphate synthase TrpC [Pseudomonadota bacterium]